MEAMAAEVGTGDLEVLETQESQGKTDLLETMGAMGLTEKLLVKQRLTSPARPSCPRATQ